MLGHSIETNLKYYSFAQKDYLDNVRALLDSVSGDAPTEPQGTPGNPSNVIHFPKKESPEHFISKVF